MCCRTAGAGSAVRAFGASLNGLRMAPSEDADASAKRKAAADHAGSPPGREAQRPRPRRGGRGAALSNDKENAGGAGAAGGHAGTAGGGAAAGPGEAHELAVAEALLML